MEPKTVYYARSKTEASIVRGWLEQEGIQAQVFDGADVAGIFDVVDSDPQIIVDESDAEKAKEIIASYQHELQQSPDMANVSDAEGQFDWPLCPVCDEMRLAACDQCGQMGSEFSTDESDQANQVICLACNNPTTISFVDNCRFCDHDFTGSTPDNVSMSDTMRDDGTSTGRVMVLVLGLLALVAILTIWFVVNL